MTFIVGVWSFNANGSTGQLRLNKLDEQGTLEVTVTFDGLDRVDPWTGTWDDIAKHIVLTRVLPGNVTQNHDGWLGDNDPNNLILAGFFRESDIPPNAARTQFGWFANNRADIIT